MLLYTYCNYVIIMLNLMHNTYTYKGTGHVFTPCSLVRLSRSPDQGCEPWIVARHDQ